MAEVEKAKQVLEAERLAVLDALAQAGKDRQAEFDRHEAALDEIEEPIYALLVRGKAAGATVIEMAEALKVTRQRAHLLLSQVEGRTDRVSSAKRGATRKPKPPKQEQDEDEHDLGGEA
jgi:hypothetical protein